MKSITISLATIAVLCVGVAPLSSGADQPFIGKWKLNLSKSKLADQMTIAPVGANRYTRSLLPVSATPRRWWRTAPTSPEFLAAPFPLPLKRPATGKSCVSKAAAAMLTANWKLSDDGKALTDTFIGNQPDGSTSRVDLIYKRADGSASNSGIPGTWETTQKKTHAAYEMEIRPYEGDGLSFIISGGGPASNVKFDGKEYPPAGASPAAGPATSARRLGDHSIELTKKLKGKIVETREITISPDLKTLTMTRHLVDQRVPNVLIFDRA